MPGPNDNLGPSGATGPSSGSEASESTTGFDLIQALAQDEERLESLYRQRVVNFDVNRGPYKPLGTPMIITTERQLFLGEEGRYIVFWAGPESVQWRFPMRASEQQTRSGTILHTWRNGSRRDTFFDEPEATFTFQAGNIMPVRYLADQDNIFTNAQTNNRIAALPAGLFDFYEFFEILNEEKILEDGRPNFVIIAYHSLVYPEIFLRGFFKPDGLSFTENAQDPASLKWTSTFKVRSTTPRFYNSSALLRAWNGAFGRGFSEIRGETVFGGNRLQSSFPLTPGTGG